MLAGWRLPCAAALSSAVHTADTANRRFESEPNVGAGGRGRTGTPLGTGF